MPVRLLNAISSESITSLIDYYNISNSIIQKNTGPKVCVINEGDDVIDNILESLRTEFGNFKVRTAHYFDVSTPHIVHVDDDFNYSNSYKAFTIPLLTEGADCNLAKLIFFDQYYYGGPAKFIRNGPANKVEYYNKNLYEYTDVENLVDTVIPNTIKIKMLSHLKDKWLEGLSIHTCFPWTIGSIIAFDSLRIHCSSNFKNAGIKRKIGLSIFTEI
jgi:hypothetical protein